MINGLIYVLFTIACAYGIAYLVTVSGWFVLLYPPVIVAVFCAGRLAARRDAK